MKLFIWLASFISALTASQSIKATKAVEIQNQSMEADIEETPLVTDSPNKVKVETFIIMDHGESNTNVNGMYTSQFLKMIKRIGPNQGNLSAEASLMLKKAQNQDGVVIHNVGDLFRVYVTRAFTPIFHSILGGFLFSSPTEIPTTTTTLPTTTKEYFYVVFETEKPTTFATATTKRGKYKVFIKEKNKGNRTKTTPKPGLDMIYVDDEDESDIFNKISTIAE